jgi:acetate kinase
MTILVLNCGSSSIKFRLLDMGNRYVLASGLVEKIGESGSHIVFQTDGLAAKHLDFPIKDHQEGLKAVVRFLQDSGLRSCDAIGHRVVHGGEQFDRPVLVDDSVITAIDDLSQLAPLHNPANLEGILIARKVFPDLPQVAVFDTAFHQTLPMHAYLYALPYQFYHKEQVRRYGFHGTSHAYVAKIAAQELKRPLDQLNLITLHLGNGASATAIKAGRSVDTSMGMTPLEGLVMGTRSGDLDPAILLHLQRHHGYSADDLDQILNKQSGLKGICGENDLREVLELAQAGDELAATAVDMLVYRIKKYLGAYAAVLGKIDGVVFTGGIGEHAHTVRSAVCEGLDTLFGIRVDELRNRRNERIISDLSSKTAVMVIPTDEELEIADQTYRLVSGEVS